MDPRPAPQCDHQRSVLPAVADAADAAANVGVNQGAASLDALRLQWPTMAELAIQLFPGIDVRLKPLFMLMFPLKCFCCF